MKILFSKADNQHIDQFGGEDELFGPDESGCFYYCSASTGDGTPGGIEEIRLEDTCGRYLPIAVEHIPSLINALATLVRVNDLVISGERATSVLEDPYLEIYADNHGLSWDNESIRETVAAYSR